METKKTYNFSTVRYAELAQLVRLKQIDDDIKFTEWFMTPYELVPLEINFLEELIKKHKYRLSYYMEETLKVKFIGAILNQVDFITNTTLDWYDAALSGTINGVEFNGFTDFMVAKGEKEPEKPYFFIQEFKPSIPDRNPENQLLAELLIAVEKNKATNMRGGFIIGQYWKFVIVEKTGENQYEYFISQSFDALKIADLKQIYIALQAVKHKYCVD